MGTVRGGAGTMWVAVGLTGIIMGTLWGRLGPFEVNWDHVCSTRGGLGPYGNNVGWTEIIWVPYRVVWDRMGARTASAVHN